MPRFALPFLVSALLLGAAGAQTLELVPHRSGDTLDLTANAVVRYSFDPVSNELTLPDAGLRADAPMPEGIAARRRGADLVLTLPVGATFALTPNLKRLIITMPSAKTALETNANGSSLVPLVVPLSNAAPQTVATILTRLYQNLRVEVDERNRALVVLVGEKERDAVRGLITQLDQERPQVMFEAQFVEVNRDTTQNLGLDYGELFKLKITEGDPKSPFRIGKIGRDALSLSIGIEALKSNGAAKILAQPRVTTLDGVEARINSTQTTPVITTNNGNSSVQSITTGITLKMVPRVAPDGTVEATLVISVSTQTGTTASGLPQFSSRDASTTVRVANGEPIVIGGLIEDREITNVQKVPLLGDLPLVGVLFQKTSTQAYHSDLIIIVTPRLIVGGDGK